MLAGEAASASHFPVAEQWIFGEIVGDLAHFWSSACNDSHENPLGSNPVIKNPSDQVLRYFRVCKRAVISVTGCRDVVLKSGARGRRQGPESWPKGGSQKNECALGFGSSIRFFLGEFVNY